MQFGILEWNNVAIGNPWGLLSLIFPPFLLVPLSFFIFLHSDSVFPLMAQVMDIHCLEGASELRHFSCHYFPSSEIPVLYFFLLGCHWWKASFLCFLYCLPSRVQQSYNHFIFPTVYLRCTHSNLRCALLAYSLSLFSHVYFFPAPNILPAFISLLFFKSTSFWLILCLLSSQYTSLISPCIAAI